MFGNMMSGKLIREAIGDTPRHIQIVAHAGGENRDFRKRIGPSTFTLFAGIVHFQVPTSRGARWRPFDLRASSFPLQPKQYVKVTPTESVILPNGIVARYEPTSDLIDEGFDLIAGKLDPGYGRKGELVTFGLQNISEVSGEISRNTRIAHMTFFDLRAISDDARTGWKRRTSKFLTSMPLLVPTGAPGEGR
jgi:deoxycytidine triphosphate deaminase